MGLPNVGKSTLFNTLTKLGIPAENFPFCTIDPNNVRSRRRAAYLMGCYLCGIKAAKLAYTSSEGRTFAFLLVINSEGMQGGKVRRCWSNLPGTFIDPPRDGLPVSCPCQLMACMIILLSVLRQVTTAGWFDNSASSARPSQCNAQLKVVCAGACVLGGVPHGSGSQGGQGPRRSCAPAGLESERATARWVGRRRRE